MKLHKLSLLATALILTSCSADWDEHYSSNTGLSQHNLMETIAADSELSDFAAMLRATGYDAVLAADQTYTVWAPTNAALQAEEITDADAQLRTVRNHIARYTFPTSTTTTTRIAMLNGKTLAYDAADAFAGQHVAKGNLTAVNGILHKVDGVVAYKYNIREYFDTHAECSALSQFVAQFDEDKYVPELSTTYDSTFVNYNALLHHELYGVGDLANEDSLYTMVIPTNEAYQAAFDRLAPAFKTYNAVQSEADSIQNVQTAQTIFRALTSRNLKPQNLTGIYPHEPASNGDIFLAETEIADIDTCLTHAIISVEAENMDGRVSTSGTNAYIRNTDINSTIQGISDNSYLEVSSGNVDGGVTIDIPGVLAQAYDIYVDFVSPIIDGERLAEQKTKVSFQLRYTNDKGRSAVSNNNTGIQVDATMGDIISVKAFEGFTFPVADYVDPLRMSDESFSMSTVTVGTTLQVKTKVSASDARNGYERLFRIDRIRFVPVKK